MKLWYNKPAAAWEEALPLGNAKTGAMVFGGVVEAANTYNYEKGEFSWREIKVEKDKKGKLKGTVSGPEKGKPNTIANITWNFMTKTK